MARNPYIAAWRTRRDNRRRDTPVAARLGRLALPLLGAALLVPLVRPVFLHFLDGSPEDLSQGLEGVTLRLGFLLVGTLSVEVYVALIRGGDRAILDLLPVRPSSVVHFEVARVLRSRGWILLLGLLLLGPVAWEGHPLAWLLGAIVAVGSFALGLSSSAMVHLLAVRAAGSERMAALLDLVRGSNPRPQAAFIYAPGVVLVLAGALVVLASRGAAWILEGRPVVGALCLAAPFAAAACAWLPVPRLAAGSWFQASAVIADIDARYGALVDRDEGKRVYLDWLARFLPATWAVWFLKDLRHGWRGRRTWITGAWLVGVGAVLAGWTSSPASPWRAAAVASAGVLVCAAIGVLMERDEPAFLREWLPSGGAARHAARLLALVGWLQAAVWPGPLAVTVRHGAGAGLAALATGEAVAVSAAALAWASGMLRERGLAVYAPAAAVSAAAVSLWALGGG